MATFSPARPRRAKTRRSAGKAAGSSATEAYSFFTRPPRAARTAQSPGGTLQGDGRLRTTLEEKRVSARRGRAGEMTGFFNSLLAPTAAVEDKGHRSVVPQLDLHVRGKDPGFHVSTVVS